MNNRKFPAMANMPVSDGGVMASIIDSERGSRTLLKITDIHDEDVRLWWDEAESLYEILRLALGKRADEVNP